MTVKTTPAQMRAKLLDCIKGNCLNGFQVCRKFNNMPEDPSRCHTLNDPTIGADHFFKCASSLWDCQTPYMVVMRRLYEMEKKGWIQSLKMRWTDNRGGNRSTDLYRFFYVKRKDLQKRFGADLLNWCKEGD